MVYRCVIGQLAGDVGLRQSGKDGGRRTATTIQDHNTTHLSGKSTERVTEVTLFLLSMR